MKNKHIIKLSDKAKTIGLSAFLITGLSGCGNYKCTKGNRTYTVDSKEQCIKDGGYIEQSSNSSHSSGTILWAMHNISNSNGSSSESSKSSGYFSSTSHYSSLGS